MLGHYVLAEMAKVIHNDDGLHVHGPLTIGVDGPRVIDEIQQFRQEEYTRTAKYLTEDFQESLEKRLKIDEKSFHFFARYQGKIIASLRITPPPFEMTELSTELKNAVLQHKNYLEIGRLLVKDGYQKAGLGKKILFQAMLFSYFSDYEGFIAICREHRRKEFERFGMKPYQRQKFILPSRQSAHYYFLTGRFSDLVYKIATYYGLKRFKNLMMGKPLTNWKKLEAPHAEAH